MSSYYIDANSTFGYPLPMFNAPPRRSSANHRGAATQEMARLESRLARRGDTEKAFFDGSRLSVPMLLLVAGVWFVELLANASNGEGWAATAHVLIVLPLQILVLVALWAGLRAWWWRARIAWLRRNGVRR